MKSQPLITRITLLLCILILTSCTSDKPTWQQLFNGKDLNDWQIKIRNYPLGENFGNTFRVVDGNIQINYDQYDDAFKQRYGHIFYEKPYSYYLLAVEYRFIGEQPKDGEAWAYRNNGVMIHGQTPESMGLDQDFPNSIEVQLLGGSGEGERSTANLCTPGTQYVQNGKIVTTHCVTSSSKTYNGDQWVRVEVLALDDSIIKHYVNGEEVVEYQEPQLDPVNGEKTGKLLTGGTISLQSESAPTEFRKVEIIDLEAYKDDNDKINTILDQFLSQKKNIPQN
ncbi:MAG TPA: DUF1080 domain-containing protein [Leeuwenhoekiella sp.]|nr:DUF1080 domain-containing protein [Leeuwenhoekiella sp.]